MRTQAEFNARYFGKEFKSDKQGDEREPMGQVCRKCGARRIDRQLGLEASPGEYVAAMVGVFREVWRVLRDDGCAWINIGDSYASSAASPHRETRDSKAMQNNGGWTNREQGKASTLGPGLKPKDLCGIPWMLAFALRDDGWYLRSDIVWAKCLSGGTVIYAKTQKGEMPMTIKDMVRLDPKTVQLWDGQKWNQAVSWIPSPRKGDEIEIELRDGAKIGCTLDHRWPVTCGMYRKLIEARDLKPGDVLASCRLPESETPRDPHGLPPLDIGWFVGLYLAEGSQSNGTIQISGHIKEAERFERLKQIVEDYDGYCFTAQTSTNGATININSPVLLGVINTYISGRIASDKHLNPRCWKRDNLFLSSVLAGYLSGDGNKATEDRWKLGFCDNDQLAADLRTLGARLGFSVRLRRAVHRLDDKEYPGWRGTIVYRPEKRHHSDFEIVSISPSRARMFWDIALESEPHLFALASGVLTHNSNPMPESVTDRPTKSHEYMFLLSKSEQYYFDADAVRETGSNNPSTQRRNACKDGGRVIGTKGASALNGWQGGFRPEDRSHQTRNIRTVWNISTESFAGSHFATFPRKLVEPCIKAGSSEAGCCSVCGAPWERVTEDSSEYAEIKNRRRSTKGYGSRGLEAGNRFASETRGLCRSRATTAWQPSCKCFPDPCPLELTQKAFPVPCTILDPFIGSGTSIIVANALGRHAIGLDLSAEYLAMAQRRINRPHARPVRTARVDESHPLFDRESSTNEESQPA